MPLIHNLEAYNAFIGLIKETHTQIYTQLRDCSDPTETFRLQGKLQLLDLLEQTRDRYKDTVENDRFNRPK